MDPGPGKLHWQVDPKTTGHPVDDETAGLQGWKTAMHVGRRKAVGKGPHMYIRLTTPGQPSVMGHPRSRVPRDFLRECSCAASNWGAVEPEPPCKEHGMPLKSIGVFPIAIRLGRPENRAYCRRGTNYKPTDQALRCCCMKPAKVPRSVCCVLAFASIGARNCST